MTFESPTSALPGGRFTWFERLSLPIAMLVVVLIVALSVRSMNFVESARAEAQHADLVHDTATALLSHLQDAETGQRGYLLTGKSAYLEPYNAARGLVREDFIRLRDNVRRLVNRARVDALQPLIDSKLTEMEHTIALYRSQGLNAALDVVQSDRGKQTMDQIRALTVEMMAEASQRSSARASEAHRAFQQFVWFGLGGSAVLLLQLTAAAVSMRRGNLRRRALTQEIARAHDLLSVTLRSIGDAVLATDMEGRVTFLNPVAQRLTGWTQDSAVGVPLSRVFRIVNETTREAVESPVDKVLRLHTVVGLANHTLLLSADGREIPIDDSAAPIRDSEGKPVGVVLVFRDITERRAQELARESQRKALEQSNSALQRSNTDLEQFAYAAGHDLQEPLRTIASFSELLARRSGRDPETVDHLRLIQGAVKRMQTLITDLLEYARVGTSQESAAVVDLNGVVGEVLWNLEASIRESQVAIHHQDLPAVIGHRGQLVQLLQNLVSNAIKYRSGELSQIWISGSRDSEGRVQVTVRDNGIGFESRYATQIFGVFKRLHTGDRYSGTGIGLATAKRIVELHGGRIWAESQPGSGSSFHFILDGAAAD